MSGPNDPTSNRGHPVRESAHRDPEPASGPATPDDDRFAAAFAAARGTVSPEFDLNGVLDEPAVTAEDAGAKPRRFGS